MKEMMKRKSISIERTKRLEDMNMTSSQKCV